MYYMYHHAQSRGGMGTIIVVICGAGNPVVLHLTNYPCTLYPYNNVILMYTVTIKQLVFIVTEYATDQFKTGNDLGFL